MDKYLKPPSHLLRPVILRPVIRILRVFAVRIFRVFAVRIFRVFRLFHIFGPQINVPQKGVGHFFLFRSPLVTFLSLFGRFGSLFCLAPFASPLLRQGEQTFSDPYFLWGGETIRILSVFALQNAENPTDRPYLDCFGEQSPPPLKL